MMKDSWKAPSVGEMNPCKLLTPNPRVDQSSVLTSDHMSLNSTDLSPVIEQADEPKSKLFQPLLKYSTKMPTSLLKRGHDLSNYIWQRLTRPKHSHRNQEDNHPPQWNPKQLESNYLNCSPKMNASQEIEDQMEVDCCQDWILMMTNQGSIESSSPAICPGTIERESSPLQRTPVAPSRLALYEDSVETSSQQNCTSNSHKELQGEFQCQSGSTSSKEKLLTLTKSCRHSTVLWLIQRERCALETLRLVSEELKQNRKLKQVLSGLQPGDRLRERLLSFLNTESENWPNMAIISKGCLPLNDLARTTRLSSLTKESGMKLEEAKPCYSWTRSLHSPTYSARTPSSPNRFFHPILLV